jgi:telomerase reverse transcriptase
VRPSDLLTVRMKGGKPGYILTQKLKAYAAPKCHPILFDSSMNNLPAVYQNTYSLGLLCAVKAYGHMRCLPQKGGKQNFSFLFEAIREASLYLCRLIQRRSPTARIHRDSSSYVRLDFVVWLSLHAYVRTMEQQSHRSLNAVTALLRAEMRLPRYRRARLALSSIANRCTELALPYKLGSF